MSDKHTDALDKLDKFQFAEGGKVLVHLDEVKEIFRATEGQAQTSAAEAARPVQPFTVKELLAMYDDNRGDWCAIARAVEQRYITELDQTRRALAAVLLEEPVAQLDDSTAPGAPEVVVFHKLTGKAAEEMEALQASVHEAVEGDLPRDVMDARAMGDSAKRVFDDPHSRVAALYAAPTAQQSLTAGGAVPDDDWIEQAVEAEFASRKHQTSNDVIRAVVARFLAAAPLPQVQSEAIPREPTEAMQNGARDWSVKKYGIGIGKDAAIGCWQAMYDAAISDQQPVTPSGALADNDGGVAK